MRARTLLGYVDKVDKGTTPRVVKQPRRESGARSTKAAGGSSVRTNQLRLLLGIRLLKVRLLLGELQHQHLH